MHRRIGLLLDAAQLHDGGGKFVLQTVSFGVGPAQLIGQIKRQGVLRCRRASGACLLRQRELPVLVAALNQGLGLIGALLRIKQEAALRVAMVKTQQLLMVEQPLRHDLVNNNSFTPSGHGIGKRLLWRSGHQNEVEPGLEP